MELGSVKQAGKDAILFIILFTILFIISHFFPLSHSLLLVHFSHSYRCYLVMSLFASFFNIFLFSSEITVQL